MKLCIFALLFALALAQIALVNSNPTTTTITSPIGHAVGIQAYHTAINPNFLGTGANWIWSNQGDSWSDGVSMVFETIFLADCATPYTSLRITADNDFTATLNGVVVSTGNDWKRAYYANVRVVCGRNNFTVNVTNKNQGTPAALIFVIAQDLTECYQCLSTLASYNPNTCTCQCIGSFNCATVNPNWIFVDYPTCGCGCPQNTSPCSLVKYLNPTTCRCECKPKICAPGYLFNPSTCECQMPACGIERRCTDGKVWSPTLCYCICPNAKLCSLGYYWSDKTCSCVAYAPASTGAISLSTTRLSS